MTKPLVSIVIPNFNRATLIGETLASIAAQTYQNWECIIVDDHSTDDSRAAAAHFLSKDRRFQWHRRPDHMPKGANACRNYGFELSKGEFLCWFDSDDVMLPNYLEELAGGFDREKSMVIGSASYVDEHLNHLSDIILSEDADLYREYVMWKQQILISSILFRREFLVGKELFSYAIRRGQETELFSRLFFELPKSAYKIIDKPLFLYRQHADTKSAKNREYVKAYKESEAYIYLEQVRRSVILKDSELYHHCYHHLMGLFFNGILNDDKKNARYIARELTPIFSKASVFKGIKFFVLARLSLVTPKGLYYLQRSMTKMSPL